MAFPGTFAVDSPAIANVEGVDALQDGDMLMMSGRSWVRVRNQVLAPVTSIPMDGGTAYSSLGTDLVTVLGTHYYGSIYLPGTKVITGIQVLQGTIAGTDKWTCGLWGQTGQTLMGTSALAGTTVTSSNIFLVLPFVTAVTLPPGTYWLDLQSNGTTDKFRAVKTLTARAVLGSSATGTFGTQVAFTPPTTFTADKAPIAMIY